MNRIKHTGKENKRFMEQKKIDRINELARTSKIRELTVQEREEQRLLRNEYRAAMRMSLINDLENTVIITPDGKRVHLKNMK